MASASPERNETTHSLRSKRCIVLYTADPDYFNTPRELRALRRREHVSRVVELCYFLGDLGVTCILDEFAKAPNPPPNWPLWFEQEIEQSDCVLLVLTPFFSHAFRGANATTSGIEEGISTLT